MKSLSLLLSVLLLVGSIGCTPGQARAPILIGQSGLALAQSIEQIRQATASLEAAKVLPTAAALRVTETLLVINNQLRPLPDLLRAIDAAQKAGQPTQNDLDRALAIVQAIGPTLSTVVAGLPVEPTTAALIELVRTAQTSVQTLLVEIARLKGATS